MKLDKPILNAFHLLGAIGSGKVGFRIDKSMDHIVRREPVEVPTPKHMLKALGQTNPMEDGSAPTMRVKRAIMARDCALRRSNPKHPEKIDRFILGVMAIAVEDSKAANNDKLPSLFVRKEALAAHLEVPEHFVAQSFERLNKLGILGPEQNVGAHDTTRGGMMGGPAAGWNGSTRDVNMGALLAHLQAAPEVGRKAKARP